MTIKASISYLSLVPLAWTFACASGDMTSKEPDAGRIDPCELEEFQCGEGVCIPRYQICNGFGLCEVDFVIQKMGEAKAANEPFLIVHNEMLPHYPMVQTPDDRAALPPGDADLVSMVSYMDKLV